MTDLPDLERLIDAVTAEAGADDPLQRLSAAARARDALDELAEAVLDHFVEQARDAGCSWSQIGTALGVSKQAAQQRHTAPESVARRLLGRIPGRRRPGGGGLFHRFSGGAREAVVRAQQEARALGHDYVGTEHVLLGLLAQADSVAATALRSLGLSTEDARRELVAIIGAGSQGEVTGHIPFTPRTKKVLELSLRESIRLGHSYIGTEHILLGLAREGEGVAMDILARRRIHREALRDAVMKGLGDGG